METKLEWLIRRIGKNPGASLVVGPPDTHRLGHTYTDTHSPLFLNGLVLYENPRGKVSPTPQQLDVM